MSEISELRQEIANMEERILTAISSVGEELRAIRTAIEVISENHLAPDHQKQVKRALATAGRR
ncbi:MAG TPA: hypothetical protein VKM72_30100 [Thermoanaerobaculia bacterium]|nr:hypothetical protein [Thermoanaerobaculia bacterium]